MHNPSGFEQAMHVLKSRAQHVTSYGSQSDAVDHRISRPVFIGILAHRYTNPVKPQPGQSTHLLIGLPVFVIRVSR